jgi:hypothetical protein
MNPSYRQPHLRLVGQVKEPRHADADVVAKLPTFRAALRYAINHSGIDQEEVAAALQMDPGCLSRTIKEPKHDNARVRNFDAAQLATFIRVTGSFAPVQWLCMQVGQEPVSMRETRAQRLRRELAELEAQEAA